MLFSRCSENQANINEYEGRASRRISLVLMQFYKTQRGSAGCWRGEALERLNYSVTQC